jgi:hypothetical protein
MWESVFVVVHAATGLTALGAGCAALTRPRWFACYAWSLAGCALFVTAAIAAGWAGLDTASRVTFPALAALALYLLWRAAAAGRLLRAGSGPPAAGYLRHIGFTLVALLDAFVVVAVLDLGAAAWLTAAAGVAVAAGGHFALAALIRSLPRRAGPGRLRPGRLPGGAPRTAAARRPPPG